MYFLVLLISGLLSGPCFCRPADSEYTEYVLSAPSISSSLQEEGSAEWSEPADDYVVTKRELIVSKDNAPVNLTNQQTFLLSDIITRIESSIIHSAFDIVSVFKTNKDNDRNSSETLSESTSRSDEPVTLFSESMATTIPATNDMPAHVSIDKVTVYEVNSGNIPFLPAFQIASGIQYEKKKPETDDKKMVKRSLTTTSAPTSSSTKVLETTPHPSSTTVDSKFNKEISSSTTESGISSLNTEKGIPSTTITSIQKINTPLPKTSITPLEFPKTSTTTPATLHPTSSEVPLHLPVSELSTPSTSESSKLETTAKTTTTKSPIDELKEQEKEAKKKIVEIEAEPVILSSRV